MTQERIWTVLELLRWTEQHFKDQGIETARLDAEVLLSHALGIPRLQLYVDFEKPIGEPERAGFRGMVVRRGRDRVPVSQLLGEREFWSLELEVSSDVLSPRPETETLVEAALALCPDSSADLRVLDVGTGSGAIALALATERPAAHVTATDISPKALQIAAANADKLHLSDRLRFLEGDLFGACPGEQFDLVVSNPPYIAERDREGLPPELDHEPEVALFGGEDGFAVVSRLVAAVSEVLTPGGVFAVEVGANQTERTARECSEAGLVEVETRRDLARRPRVVTARKLGGESL